MNPNPTPGDWVDLLDALADMAKAGRLASLTFMLTDPARPDAAVIDHYGTPELTEIACRKTVEQIAVMVQLENPVMSKAIRDGLPAARPTH